MEAVVDRSDDMPIENPDRPLTVAVVGATGLVGRTMLEILTERGFPIGELRALASRADGRSVEAAGRTWPVAVSSPESFEGVDIALFSAGGDTSAALAPEAAKRGAVVVDNSSQWRMTEGVPLVVAGVNDDDAAEHEGIIANPNCSTMQLMPVFRAIHDAVGIERAIVDTYQAVSGTGNKAVAELDAQVRAYTEDEVPTAEVYPHQIAFNALPQVDVFTGDGYTKEEHKLIDESRKILHLPELRISCTAVRIPVFTAHSEAVHLELGDSLDPGAARELLAAVPGVIVQDEPAAAEYPLALDAAGHDEVFVGRIRRDPSAPGGRGLALWVVSDNLRKGAATNAVEIAELLVRRGWLTAASRRAIGVA